MGNTCICPKRKKDRRIFSSKPLIADPYSRRLQRNKPKSIRDLISTQRDPMSSNPNSPKKQSQEAQVMINKLMEISEEGSLEPSNGKDPKEVESFAQIRVSETNLALVHESFGELKEQQEKGGAGLRGVKSELVRSQRGSQSKTPIFVTRKLPKANLIDSSTQTDKALLYGFILEQKDEFQHLLGFFSELSSQKLQKIENHKKAISVNKTEKSYQRGYHSPSKGSYSSNNSAEDAQNAQNGSLHRKTLPTKRSKKTEKKSFLPPKHISQHQSDSSIISDSIKPSISINLRKTNESRRSRNRASKKNRIASSYNIKNPRTTFGSSNHDFHLNKSVRKRKVKTSQFANWSNHRDRDESTAIQQTTVDAQGNLSVQHRRYRHSVYQLNNFTTRFGKNSLHSLNQLPENTEILAMQPHAADKPVKAPSRGGGLQQSYLGDDDVPESITQFGGNQGQYSEPFTYTAAARQQMLRENAIARLNQTQQPHLYRNKTLGMDEAERKRRILNNVYNPDEPRYSLGVAKLKGKGGQKPRINVQNVAPGRPDLGGMRSGSPISNHRSGFGAGSVIQPQQIGANLTQNGQNQGGVGKPQSKFSRMKGGNGEDMGSQESVRGPGNRAERLSKTRVVNPGNGGKDVFDRKRTSIHAQEMPGEMLRHQEMHSQAIGGPLRHGVNYSHPQQNIGKFEGNRQQWSSQQQNNMQMGLTNQFQNHTHPQNHQNHQNQNYVNLSTPAFTKQNLTSITRLNNNQHTSPATINQQHHHHQGAPALQLNRNHSGGGGRHNHPQRDQAALSQVTGGAPSTPIQNQTAFSTTVKGQNQKKRVIIEKRSRPGTGLPMSRMRSLDNKHSSQSPVAGRKNPKGYPAPEEPSSSINSSSGISSGEEWGKKDLIKEREEKEREDLMKVKKALFKGLLKPIIQRNSVMKARGPPAPHQQESGLNPLNALGALAGGRAGQQGVQNTNSKVFNRSRSPNRSGTVSLAQALLKAGGHGGLRQGRGLERGRSAANNQPQDGAQRIGLGGLLRNLINQSAVNSREMSLKKQKRVVMDPGGARRAVN